MLRRNPGYPGPRPQRLEAIEVTIGTTPERAVAEVEAGRADYVPSVPLGAQARLIARYGPGSRAAASGRQRYFAGPQPVRAGLVFNPRRPLFARAAMRRAVNYAIDRRALARTRSPEARRAGRPTSTYRRAGPGSATRRIYPLGGPDLATARRLAGGGRRRGVLYTCNDPDASSGPRSCARTSRRSGSSSRSGASASARCSRGWRTPDEPFDLSFFGWIGDAPRPVGVHRRHVRLLHEHAVPRSHAAGAADARREPARGAARIEAYAALDRDIAAQAAPFAPIVSGARTDFFSARIGCQVEHPLYGIDLAALCVRDG